MKIAADIDIPFVNHYFAKDFDLTLFKGRELKNQDLLNQDVLIVRSITKVNADLLKNTNIKFVVSPTTGFDHLDIKWLAENNIAWDNAPGCNATAVAEYIVCLAARLQKLKLLKICKPKVAVVGVGRIGSKVVKLFEDLNFDVLQCDPVRAEKEKDFPHVPFDEIKDVDLITLHTPLTKIGKHQTFHMVDEGFLLQQKKNTILVNTGRGSVINFDALKLSGQHLAWCLDVWENEPHIDFEILDKSVIATPHIAGYTVQSKYRGIKMVYAAFLSHFKLVRTIEDLAYPKIDLDLADSLSWQDKVLQVYDPLVTTKLMKQAVIENGANGFDGLRKNFADTRYEFAYAAHNINLVK